LTTICTICARGGSTGIPRKNILPLLGKPLIEYTINQALACPQIDGVYLSTDDDEIAEVGRRLGAIVPFLRPLELAGYKTPKLPVIEHMVKWVISTGVSVKTVVDLDPTSPLREVSDIQACLELLGEDTDVVITGYEADKNPYFNMVEKGEGEYYSLVKEVPGGVWGRQSAPQVYSMNASVYVWHVKTLKKGIWGGNAKLHIMPRERSIDIDDPIDFEFVEMLMRKKNKKP
jgi:CMP-N,N'-diacetyllegionaminic acid synthase